MILSLLNNIAALVTLMFWLLLFHLYIPLYWKSITAFSAMRHFVSGMNFLKNFANLLMMSPCHCHLIFLSPGHHHHHHFHYASLHLCSTPDSKLTFSINHSYNSLPHLFGLISRIFKTIFGHRSNCSKVFVFLFSSFFVRFVWQTKLIESILILYIKSLHFPSFLPSLLPVRSLSKTLLFVLYLLQTRDKEHYSL